MKTVRLLTAVIFAIGVSCGPADFDPQSKIDSVRILASRADKPYAKPGDTVRLEVLSVDGRADTKRPMQLYWIPFVCENPKNDAYYGCFALPTQSDGGADAAPAGGARGSANPGLGLLRPGLDLTPFLTTGPSFDFQMPLDAITTHPHVNGVDEQYGLAIVFNVACAGHLEVMETDPAAGLQQVPIGCFDDDRNRVDPSEYVIGFTRAYAYASRTNANPVVASVTFEGRPVNLAKGIKVDRCTTAKRSECPEVSIDVSTTDASWEENPGDKDPDGNIRHEQLWATYFASVGELGGNARLLYDPVRGKIDRLEIKYQAPNEAGDGTLWIVVHDNRGGTTWVLVPLHVR